METTFFFKNANNLADLEFKTSYKEKQSQNIQSYFIIKKIELSSKEYLQFCNKFKYNYEFLFKFLDQMKIQNNVWHSVLVTSENERGILVMNNGYLYPIFTALPENYRL